MRNYLQNRKNSFIYAIKGIRMFFTEPHAKLHSIISVLVLTAAYIFQFSLIEWCIVFLCIGTVLSAELFNSTIEKIVDKISPEHNIQAGIIKDMAAGAVLLLCIFVAAVGLLLFVPKIILLL